MKGLYILFIGILFCSCGTTKRSTEIDRSETSIRTITDSMIQGKYSVSTKALYQNNILKAHVLVTEWLPPDSTGAQYPSKTTDIDISSNSDKSIIQQDSSALLTKKQRNDNTVNQGSEQIKDDIKKDNRVVSTWWLLIGGIIAALLIWIINRR